MKKSKKCKVATGTPEEDFQCVLVGTDMWHLTQEQVEPPSVLKGGAYTSCSIWAEFTRGYDRRRPTCPICLKHVEEWEEKQKGMS